MDPVILLGGFSAFNALYPFMCTPRMVLLEPERRALTIYPSEILEGALYQGSASQASDFRIIKNLHITHVVNATANSPDAFPNTLSYLRLRLSDDAQQDLVEALPLASRFINTALKAEPAGRVLVHCSLGRSRSSALTLAFLMEHRRWSLLHALRWMKERRACTAPNVNFLRQLLTYEETLFGKHTEHSVYLPYTTFPTRGKGVALSGTRDFFYFKKPRVNQTVIYRRSLGQLPEI
uniref:protein-tyrosine-phosphatase n=1 Tax=Scophthalmus maximus TaxID=52904 RepID=A0A8D3DJC4_SCOMX